MEVASGAIAVMQLCFQIADSVQRIRTFVRSVKEAPEQLQRLIDKIDFLWQLLSKIKDLIEHQRTLSSQNASMALISTALAPCVSSVKKLERNIAQLRSGIDHPNALQRKRHALRSVLRKDILEELGKNVNENISNLQAVLMVETIELQVHNSQCLADHARPLQAASLPLDTRKQSRTPLDCAQELDVFHSPTLARRQDKMRSDVETLTYRSILGEIHIRKETEYRCGRAECAQRSSLVVSVPFLPSYVEWQSLNIYGKIARTLMYYPIMYHPESYSDLWENDDTSAFQNALSRREFSPFARSQWGCTLLHFAAAAGNSAICSLLIHLGANPNMASFYGFTPLHFLFWTHKNPFPVNCLRLMIAAQRGVTEGDLDIFYRHYNGPTEAAEIMFTYDTDFNTTPSRRNDRSTALHMAVRNLSRDNEQWRGMTRRLLRTKLDVHAQDRGGRSVLDGILKHSGCPCNSHKAVALWLSILREESFDVMAYLREEMTLDIRKKHVLCNGCRGIPKGSQCLFEGPYILRNKIMIFEMDPPRVWLEYHFDPKSPVSLVWNEFGHFDTYHDNECSRLQDVWPFEFPKWMDRMHYRWDRDYDYPCIAWMEERDLARSRRDRRAEKKAQKLARAQGRRGLRVVPGAWIA